MPSLTQFDIATARAWLRAGVGVALLRSPALVVLLVLVLLAALTQPAALGLPIVMIVLRQAVPLGLLALGQSLPMLGRSIDLSVGGVVALVNVLLALPYFHAGSAWLALLMPLVLGAFIGVLNGCFIVRLRASAVMVTLGMSIMLVGLSYLVSDGAPGGQVHPVVRLVATYRIGLFPVAALVLLLAAVLLAFMLHRLVLGRTLHALGSNFQAAWLSGLPVARTLLVAHGLCGVLAGLAGIMLTGYIGTGSLNLGNDLVLASVAAVVLGGVNFGDNQGGSTGVVLGALSLTYLGNLLTSMGIEQPYQLVLQGVIVVSAVALAQRKQRSLQLRPPQTRGAPASLMLP